jgi:hypothetical protein
MREDVERRHGKKLRPISLFPAKRLAEAERFAEREGPVGFPFLYSIASVQLWALLESAVDDLVAEILTQRPQAMMEDSVRRVKGPLVEFALASATERAEVLGELLSHEVGARFKLGVGRFETVLAAVGFGGPVADGPRRWLLELSQVRNAVVHCGSTVDARFASLCPWLGLSSGQVLRISGSRFASYIFSSIWYLLELLRRWEASDASVTEHDRRNTVEFMAEVEQLAGPDPASSAQESRLED